MRPIRPGRRQRDPTNHDRSRPTVESARRGTPHSIPRASPCRHKVLRSFTQPRGSVAVEEVADFAAMSRPTWPEPTDQLDIVLVAPGGGEPGPLWLAAPDRADALPAVSVKLPGVTADWRPGRAVLRAPADRFDEFVAGLTEFAFYEGELRTLERAVEVGESDAAADTVRAFRIRPADSKHWPRFESLIEHFARLRLTFARLKPRLAKPSNSLKAETRRLVNRLLMRADVPARLEALSERLEACEDLYEGAIDRVADYRWYRTGHRLEWGIIFLLLLEVALMSADLYIRYLDYSDPTPVETNTQEIRGAKKN